MATKTFVAKNGLTANTANVFFSDISGTLTPTAGGKILIIDGTGQVGFRTEAQILSDIGASTTQGTVTTVSAGNGMDFTDITATGSVSLGTPSALDTTTTSSVTSTSHTHAITTSSDVSAADGTGSSTILAATNTGSLYLKGLQVGTGKLQVEDTTNATSTTDGSLQTDGGLSVAKSAYIGEKLTVVGDLEVQGTTTTVSSTETVIADKIITLNDGGGAASATLSGIELEEDGTATGYVKTDSNRDWTLKGPANAGVLTLDINATKTITVAGALNIEGDSAINQDVTTDASVQFGGITTSGDVLPNASGTINLGSGTAEFGNVFIATSKVLNFGSGQEATIQYDGTALTFGGTAAISLTNGLTVGGAVVSDSTTEATSTTVGSIQTDGGLAVAKNIYGGANVHLEGTSISLASSNTTVQQSQIRTFSGTVGTSATEVLLAFKCADGTSSPSGATNFLGAEVLLTMKQGTSYETQKVLIHVNSENPTDGNDIYFTEYATLGTQLTDTLTVNMTNADGTSHTTNTDKYVTLKLNNSSGTDSILYTGMASLLEIPGDS